MLHEISSRLVVETDPQTLHDLTEQLIEIAQNQLWRGQPN
jgi:hypothetical protein